VWQTDGIAVASTALAKQRAVKKLCVIVPKVSEEKEMLNSVVGLAFLQRTAMLTLQALY